MLEKGFTFNRKFFVKDLLNPNECLKNAALLEFESFNAFTKTVITDTKINIGNASKFIVPVRNSDEVLFLLRLNPVNRPHMIIKLEDFSHETLDSFFKIPNTSLLIDEDNITNLKQSLLDKPSNNFCKFCMNTYGYVRINISADDVHDWVYRLTDAFFAFPFFCIADVHIDYLSFNDMPITTMDAIEWQCNILANNMKRNNRGLNWKAFGAICENECTDGDCKGTCLEKGYEYDTIHYSRAKRVFVSDEGKMYIETKEFKASELDLYKDYDCEALTLRDIDPIRACYDAKITQTCGVKDVALISLYQNYQIYGNVAMVPYITYAIDRASRGERA